MGRCRRRRRRGAARCGGAAGRACIAEQVRRAGAGQVDVEVAVGNRQRIDATEVGLAELAELGPAGPPRSWRSERPTDTATSPRCGRCSRTVCTSCAAGATTGWRGAVRPQAESLTPRAPERGAEVERRERETAAVYRAAVQQAVRHGELRRTNRWTNWSRSTDTGEAGISTQWNDWPSKKSQRGGGGTEALAADGASRPRDCATTGPMRERSDCCASLGRLRVTTTKTCSCCRYRTARRRSTSRVLLQHATGGWPSAASTPRGRGEDLTDLPMVSIDGRVRPARSTTRCPSMEELGGAISRSRAYISRIPRRLHRPPAAIRSTARSAGAGRSSHYHPDAHRDRCCRRRSRNTRRASSKAKTDRR